MNAPAQDMNICPKCLCEFLSHVENCADCGETLITVEEHGRRQEEKKRCMETPLENPVAVREGEVTWISELHGALINDRIPCRIHADPSCGKGCRGNTCQLLVSGGDLERAHERCEEYFAEVHPEARTSQELISQGKCPACGSTVGPAEAECPDCGLTLLIVE